MAEYIKKNRRRFDRQFKEDAVALVRSGRSQAVVARDLGGFLRRALHLGPAAAPHCRAVETGRALTESKALQGQSSEQRELRRLRQENDYLREQRDILKKALGILSVEVPASASR